MGKKGSGSISDFTQGLRDQEPTAPELPVETVEPSQEVPVLVKNPITDAVAAKEPIVIPQDHPDYEFLKNRPQAGTELYGCVMVDQKMFAKLYHGCIHGQTLSFTGQAAIRFFAEMLGSVGGNREEHLKFWNKYKELYSKSQQ